jgi:hypothetical protein
MEQFKDMDPSIVYFILKLIELLKEETYDYSYYDFDSTELKEKDELYIRIEEIKKNKSYMKSFCDEINTKIQNYQITHIENIICGITYKNSKDNIPLRIPIGYHYSFTVICKKK